MDTMFTIWNEAVSPIIRLSMGRLPKAQASWLFSKKCKAGYEQIPKIKACMLKNMHEASVWIIKIPKNIIIKFHSIEHGQLHSSKRGSKSKSGKQYWLGKGWQPQRSVGEDLENFPLADCSEHRFYLFLWRLLGSHSMQNVWLLSHKCNNLYHYLF